MKPCVLIGALVPAFVAAGCHTTKKSEAAAEPVQKTEAATAPQPAAAPAAPTAKAPESKPVSLGSNPQCGIRVTAKSPHAVADPCLSTESFVESLTALSEPQKRQALKMIAASNARLQKEGARRAH